MFRFENPEFLYALLILPLLFTAGVWVAYRRRSALWKLGEEHTLRRLIPVWSTRRQWSRWIMIFLAMLCLIIAWANPQWGSKRQKITRKAADIILALDISQSMLTEDIAPNRMELAKRFGQQILEALRGERIGLILFAAGAYTQAPLTTDYGSLVLFLQSSSPDLAPYQGTSIGAAIDLAGRLFEPKATTHKALIVITDGETHDSEAIEKARAAKEKGVLLFTVAVGTEEGGFVPEWINGRKAIKKDKAGNPVRSRVNVAMLRQLAAVGGGQFFALRDGKEVISQISKAVELLDRRELEERVYDEYDSYFQYFIGIALILLFAEFFAPALRRKNDPGANYEGE
ncbi:MAG: VWA domain-containing protein [Saprospirales bacterium]|nr:VWA domain-containing protein [Saprospirales bacterium]